VEAIEIQGAEDFALERTTQPGMAGRRVRRVFAADPGLVNELLGSLSALEVVEFVKDGDAAGLTTYGLGPPVRQFILKTAPPAGIGRDNTSSQNWTWRGTRGPRLPRGRTTTRLTEILFTP